MDNDEQQTFHVEASSSAKKLIHTADIIQRRFRCSVDELAVWRNILLFRYSSISHSSLDLQVTDFDQSDGILSGPGDGWISRVPEDLAKTTIRIFCESAKRITLTLYFKTASDSGTLLCQGKDCRHWDRDECEKLKEIVSSYMLDENLTNLINALIAVPVTFIKDLGSLPISAPVQDPVQEQNAKTAPDEPSSTEENHNGSAQGRPCPTESTPPQPPISPCLTLLTCEVTPQNVVLLPPTPTLSDMASASSETLPKAFKATPLRFKQRLRRKTLCTNQNPKRISVFTLQAYQQQIQNLQETIHDLISAQDDMKENFLTKIEDVKTSTKNEMKGFFRIKFDNVNLKLEETENQIEQLNVTIQTLTKENHSLKSQLGDVRAELKSFKSRPPGIDASTQHCETVPDTILPPVKTQPQQSPLPQCQEVNTGSTDEQNGSKVMIKEQQPSLLTEKSVVFKELTTTDQSKELKGPEDSDIVSSLNQLDTHVDYNVPVKNAFAVFSDQDLDNVTSTVSPQHHPKSKSGSDNIYSDSGMFTPKPSASDVLGKLSVKDWASALLIGDSVLSHLDPKRLALRSYRLQKICVGGMTVPDLTQWLNHQPVNDSIRGLIIHVGVNDCSAGPVTVEMWTDLIHLCHKVFPNAHLAFSSLVPAKGMHHLNNIIFPTNRNLKKACSDVDTNFIDQASSFTAISGAPKLSMYKDSTHPSFKGTAQLASNIKGILIEWIQGRSTTKQDAYQKDRILPDSRKSHYIESHRMPRPPMYNRPSTHSHRNFISEPHQSYDHGQSVSPHPPHFFVNSRESSGVPISDNSFAPYHNRHHNTSDTRSHTIPSIHSLLHFPPLTSDYGSSTPPVPPPHSVSENHGHIERQSNDYLRNKPPPLAPLFHPEMNANNITMRDMNRYVHMLNVMTSQFLNSQHGTY